MSLFRVSAALMVISTALSVDPWTIISPNVATVITGIACTTNKTCYIPADVNGVGTQVLRSEDGGVNWKQSHSEPFALLLLDISASGKNVAVMGALSLMYSEDSGVNFNESLAPLGAGQCIRKIGQINSPQAAPQVGFGAVGDFGLFSESNGVALSVDGGKTYAAENITVIVADSRYGAFPTDTTFFVAAGDWPGEGADDDPCDDPPCGLGRGSLFKRHGDLVNPEHYTTLVPAGSRVVKTKGSRLHLLQTDKDDVHSLLWAVVKREDVIAANAGQGAGPNITSWEAQIAKSTDAGKTWTKVFSKFGAYYLNDIECTSVNTCCAVGEKTHT